MCARARVSGCCWVAVGAIARLTWVNMNHMHSIIKNHEQYWNGY